MDIALFGIQGSGKGTHARHLSQEFGWPVFHAGEELRAIAAQDTEDGRIVASYIDHGNKVPCKYAIDLLMQFLSDKSPDEPVIYDGIPRDLEQMAEFNRVLQEADRQFLCLYLRLDPQVGLARVIERAKKENRADDSTIEKIQHRMNWTLSETMPVLDEYRKQGRVIEVDVDRPIEEVYADIRAQVMQKRETLMAPKGPDGV